MQFKRHEDLQLVGDHVTQSLIHKLLPLLVISHASPT